jgi:excisionase family DNA binding protein
MDSRVRPWLSPEELAEELGVPLGSIYQWNTKRTGPPVTKVGKHIRYSRRAVDAWLAGNTQQAS